MLRGTYLALNGEDGFERHLIPALARTSANTVLAAYEAVRAGSEEITVMIRRSEDYGDTWGDPIEVTPPGSDFATKAHGCPSFVVDQITGGIYLMTSIHMEASHIGGVDEAFPSWRNSLEISLFYSQDDGRTWAPRHAKTQINARHPWVAHAATPGHGMQITSGTWTGRLIQPTLVENPDGSTSFVCVCSDDEGMNWWAGNPLVSEQESASVIQLADGNLMLRTRSGFDDDYGMNAYSYDGGRTWSAAEHWEADPDTIFSDMYERAFPNIEADRPEAHVWAQAYLQRHEGGFKGYIRVTEDDFKTWPHTMFLADGLQMWPDAVMFPEKRLLIGICTEHKGVHAWQIPYDDLGIGEMARGWMSSAEEQDQFLSERGLL